MTIDVPFLLLGAACLLASFVHGFCGFGFGILLMAQLALAGAGLERASVLTTLLALCVTATIWIQARRDLNVDWRAVFILASGTILGLPLGYAFVYRYENLPLGRALFGAVLLAFAAQGLWRPQKQLRIPGWAGPLFGVAGGFLSGAYSSSGPPFVLYLYFREDDPRVAKRTIQVIFTFLSVYRIIVILCGPRGIPAPMLVQGILLVPLALAGTWIGHRMFRRTGKELFSRVVYLLLGGAGCVQIVRAVSSA